MLCRPLQKKKIMIYEQRHTVLNVSSVFWHVCMCPLAQAIKVCLYLCAHMCVCVWRTAVVSRGNE